MPSAPRDVMDIVRPEWPPLRHVRHGWDTLSAVERTEVQERVHRVLAAHAWGAYPRDALLHLMTFLAQVETIAIEIPLRFLPQAPETLAPTLRRQLVDEVFHSTLFARLAHELAAPAAQPPAPLASAERLLDRIRGEPDLAVSATLLNLVAEGWIETLFKHLLAWNVNDAVFRAVLADEERHVHEAGAYLAGLDRAKAQAAVETFERGMLEVGSEPAVALALLDLAGPDRYRALTDALDAQHRAALTEAGLRPSVLWDAARQAAAPPDPDPPTPSRVADTQWRRLARRVWQTPRDPTMQGDFDVPIGHVPRRLLTPVLIAAVGRAWARHPELNRVVARDGVWQLADANVGVRVLLGDDELATVVVPQADRRSPRDIQRMLADGIDQLERERSTRPASSSLPDAEVAALVPPAAHLFSVALSNAGKWGVVSGAGSFSGWVSASTDITVGMRRRLPRWYGVAYWPAWHVNLAAIQDHRVFDGRAAAVGFTSLREALAPEAVSQILATPDTIPPMAEHVRDAAFADLRRNPPVAPQAAAFFGTLGLSKYAPVAIGGFGLGAVAGTAGYLIYRYYRDRALTEVVASAPRGPR